MEIQHQPSAFKQERDRVLSRTFLHRLDVYEELSSTNDLAVSLARQQDTATPIGVWAMRQTSGRGRGANRWWSQEGALTFSVVFDAGRFDLAKQRWPQISMAAALAVCEMLDVRLESADAPSRCQVKWPNDVYLADRKISGLLVEAPAHPADRIVIGVGVNVNNSLAKAPAEVRETAISLLEMVAQPQPLVDVFIDLLIRLDENLSRLSGDLEEWRQRLESRFLLAGRQVQWTDQNNTVVGRCLGVARDGALIVENTQGQRRFYSGTVRVLR